MNEIIHRPFSDFDSDSGANEKSKRTKSEFVKSSFDFDAEFKKEKGSVIVKIVTLVGIGILFFEALIYFFQNTALSEPKITFTGISKSDEQKMRKLLEPLSAQNWLEFDSENAVSLLTSAPYVEDAQIMKRFPKKIVINILERKPVATTFLTGEGKTSAVQIDKKGVIFYRLDKKNRELPIVSGIPIENVPEGMRIPEKYVSLMERIDNISHLKQNYLAGISEIHILPKDAGNYELALYPLNSRVKILLDRAMNEEALQRMVAMFSVSDALEPRIKELDLRYGNVSYKY